MALDAGNEQASDGMAKDIYDYIEPNIIDEMEIEDKTEIKKQWKEVSYWIAKGVIDAIKRDMEINGVTVELPAASHIISVSGGGGAPAVGVPNPAAETHIQNNDGIGLVD